MWAASSPEPADWQRSGTDGLEALQGPGEIGLSSYLPGSSADQAPVTLSFHDFEAVNPSQLPNRAPTAAFSFQRDGLVVDFDASGSSDPDGSLASYAWEFGDGSTGTGVTLARPTTRRAPMTSR